MNIDVDKLRKDMKKDNYGAFFAGGYGGALMEAMDFDRASDDEIISAAKNKGLDLNKYRIRN